MNDHSLYPWDHYSDQPKIIRDKKYKRKLYVRALWYFLKSLILLPLFPLFAIILLFKKPTIAKEVGRGIGLSVHVETDCEGKHIVPTSDLKVMVDDLGVKQLLVRIPLADSGNIQTYIDHIDAISGDQHEVTVNLVQDRVCLDDIESLRKTLHSIIGLLKDRVTHIHVGNAYNRRKWAFYHFGEYHRFFQTIRSVSSQIAPDIKLVGGSVIDFEIPPFLESLFHFKAGHYDGYSAQLYVDRRGAPENKQLGFDFLRKINLIDLMRNFSWKIKGPLWITEMNWALDAGKFSPCKGSVQVDEQTQADFLTRAYLASLASGKIRTCYWHQLVAPGYGLVDNREQPAIQRPSYYAFKAINSLFNRAKILSFSNGNHEGKAGFYSVRATKKTDNKLQQIQAYWSTHDIHHLDATNFPESTWLDQSGNELTIEDQRIQIGSSVVYALTTTK